MNKTLKASIGYIISNFLLKGIAIITTPIFTRLLTTEDYGYVSNFGAWLSILGAIIGLGLPYSIGRAKLDFKGKFDGYLSSVLMLSMIFSTVILAFVLFNLPFVSEYMKLKQALVIFMFFYLIFEPAISFYSLKLRYNFEAKKSIIISLIDAIGGAIAAVCLVIIIPDEKYIGRILGTYVVPLFMGGYCTAKILNIGKKFVCLSNWIYALSISIPMVFHGISMLLLSQIDRIIILRYCNASELGLYSFACSYSVLLSTFCNAIGMAWLPWFNETVHAGEKQKVSEFTDLINNLMGLVSLVLVGIAPEVMLILGTKNYLPAKSIVVPLVVGGFCQYCYTNYINYELYEKKTIYISIGSIVAAAVNYILNIIFVQMYGYEAAAYTTLIGYFLLMILHYSIYKLVLKGEIYNNIRMFELLFCVGGSCVVLGKLYEIVLLRYVALVAVSILFFIHNNFFMWIRRYIMKGTQGNA